MYKRHFGIKLKITIAFSLIFILLSFSFNLYTYRQIRSLMIADNDNSILARANALLSKIELSPIIIPLPENNTSMRVFYHSGKKIINVFESPGMNRQIKTPNKTGVTDTLGMRVAYVISSNEENPAELVIARSGKHLADNLRYLLILLFACSLISVFMAGLISYILAFYLLQPVQRIINAARVINTNQLRDMIPVKNTSDELQELTETINSMLVRIDDSLQQRQNFFASASHELKTPLAIMRAEIEVELMKSPANEGRALLLSSQLAEINRLQQVVQEFLLVSQLKSGGITLYKQQVDLSEIILKLFNKLSPLLRPKNLKTEIRFDRETESFTIQADLDKLVIMLMNIIENAIKYSVEDQSIGCHVQEINDQHIIQIAITNITEEECIPTEKLQVAFYRENMRQNGAGIGLWLSREIVTMHGGSLDFISHDHHFTAAIKLPLAQ